MCRIFIGHMLYDCPLLYISVFPCFPFGPIKLMPNKCPNSSSHEAYQKFNQDDYLKAYSIHFNFPTD